MSWQGEGFSKPLLEKTPMSLSSGPRIGKANRETSSTGRNALTQKSMTPEVVREGGVVDS